MGSNPQPGVTSSEEIIKEVMKDWNSLFVKVNDDCTSSNECAKSDTNNGSPHDSDTDVSRDFIDEELLKDREIGLTKREKEFLRDEAEELKIRGNELFKSGEYVEAISFYTKGIKTCSLAYDKERAILYANRAAAKTKCLEKESALSDYNKAIELYPTYVKAIVKRAHLHKDMDKLDEAMEDFKKINSLDPRNAEVQLEIRTLAQQIEEKNEKMKTEMLGKLKDLGNMVLKPFGLSTNNFELQKDPNSGGYSVKFNQNPN